MNASTPMKVGIVGAGNISATYVATLHTFDFVKVKSVYDMSDEAAGKLAAKFGLQAVSFEAMIADPEIGLIINLTTPTAHHAISKAALQAGKIDVLLPVSLDQRRRDLVRRDDPAEVE